MDYKQKYLKYKDKYLKLKNKYLIGGSNCPQVGFHQHINECWHDSFLMIILYSDNFSERLQRLFDSSNFNIDECLRRHIELSEQIFIPIQIETSSKLQLLKFEENAKNYIKNIYERYKNEKRRFTESRLELSLSSDTENIRPVYAAPTEIATRTLPKIARLDSINESLMCSYSSYELTNMNLLEHTKRTYSHNNHIGIYLHDLNNINLINYYLTNYMPHNIFFPADDDMKKKFLYTKSFKLVEMFLIRDLQNINIDDFSAIINEIYDKITFVESFIKSTNLLGITLSVSSRDLLEGIESVSNHMVAFMKCNGDEKFYDNNGVHDIDVGEPFEIPPEPKDTSKLVKYQDYYMKKQGDLMMKFEWKKYLLDVIAKCRSKLFILNRSNSKDKPFIIKNIHDAFSSLSELFQPGPNKCGREYLDTHLITDMEFIFVNNIEGNIKDEYISANIDNILRDYLFYTNDRVYDLVSTILQKYPDSNLFQDVFFKLAQFENHTLLSKLIKDTKQSIELKFECIHTIINDILEQPHEQINENLIKVFMSSIRDIMTLNAFMSFKEQLVSMMKSKPYYYYYSSVF